MAVVTGERDLGALLHGLQPQRHPYEYVFTTVTGVVPPGVHPVVMVAEPEGTTLVVMRAEADAAGLPYDFVASWITLRVHSALDAVGLTAAVSTALADVGISCNVVAGYFHDHLFVGCADADQAMAVLTGLSTATRPINA
ncbi:hypothetical protein Cme02nite_65500 [Catellatospora methionotrophica]|uniref:Uncharacterized protein n=1 Tax=Catellatospora methionotrophica TaxID=121620 RepID=A0A8J3LC57_9ACTN|nr:hypothetical protein Cme02nite_65500 [Catellatospora methionotrophica]